MKVLMRVDVAKRVLWIIACGDLLALPAYWKKEEEDSK